MGKHQQPSTDLGGFSGDVRTIVALKELAEVLSEIASDLVVQEVNGGANNANAASGGDSDEVEIKLRPTRDMNRQGRDGAIGDQL